MATNSSQGPPRRKSLAGPLLAANLQNAKAVRQSFAVTGQFLKTEKGRNEGILKSAAIQENLTINGSINILSCIETTKDILCCKYTEEMESLAVGFTDGLVRLFKNQTNETMKTLYDLEINQDTAPVTCIKHRPVSKNYPITNCITCTYANGCVKCWNYNFEQCVYTIREKRQTFGITYHPRLPKFITYGDDMKIYLYDEETRTQERILTSSDAPGTADGHVSRIFAACFNPRSNHEFISGGWDDVVHFWDLRQPHAFRRLSGIHMCGEGLDISPQGTEVLTCAWQKEHPLQLWDYASGNLLVTMEPDVHESMLYCGRYISKDYIAVGGTDKSILRVVDLRTFMTESCITGLESGVYGIDVGLPKKRRGDHPKEPLTKLGELAAIPKLAFCAGKKALEELCSEELQEMVLAKLQY